MFRLNRRKLEEIDSQFENLRNKNYKLERQIAALACYFGIEYVEESVDYDNLPGKFYLWQGSDKSGFWRKKKRTKKK